MVNKTDQAEKFRVECQSVAALKTFPIIIPVPMLS